MTSDDTKTLVDVLTGLREDMRALIAQQRFQTIAIDQNTVALRSLGQKLNVIDRNTTVSRAKLEEVHGAAVYPGFAKRRAKKGVSSG